MNYLVDTHYLIWALVDPEQIRESHRAILLDEHHTKFVSTVSFWEISLKYGLGKLKLTGVTPEEVVEAAIKAGFAVLAVTADQMASSYRLEYVGSHKDPFDRLLIWQCMKRDFVMLTGDREIMEYASVGLRVG